MSKRFRKIKKHLAYHHPTYTKIIVILLVLIAVLWSTSSLDDEDVVPVRDGSKSELMGVSFEVKYQEALELEAAGEKGEAHMIMVRLAPLSEGDIKPRGYAPAHLWIAKESLGRFMPDFLKDFPLDAMEGKPSVPPHTLGDDGGVLLAQRYLEHTIALAPEMGEAPLMLSALWISRGRRDLSLEVLISAISHPTHPHPELLAVVCNLLTYNGDDLAMEEKAWLSLSVLGQSVSKARARENFAQRIEYASVALILKKFDLAASVIRKLERDFSNTEKFPQAAASIDGLKMALEYRKAVLLAGVVASKPAPGAEDYALVVEALGKVLEVQPDQVAVIKALSTLAKRYPSLSDSIQEILKKSTQSTHVSEGAAMAKAHLILGDLTGDDVAETKKHLESALLSSPDDPDVLIGLAGLLIESPQPDYSRVKQLTSRAIQLKIKQGGGGGVQPDDYRIQGEAELGLKNWEPAIVSLEKALPNHSEKRLVHQLLAKAYLGAGRPKLAKEHEGRGGATFE